MSRIFVTGDTHGDVYERCEKLVPFLDKDEENFLIICGDFGLIWSTNEDRLDYEKEQIEKIGELPLTVLFCDGNHECFDRLNSEFPEIDFYGGRVHKISDNIYHLMRGYMFDIAGKKIFVFGGARSHDIWNLVDPDDPDYTAIVHKLFFSGSFYREIGVSWWEDEIATPEEFTRGFETLKENDFKCDIIISHEAPKSDANWLGRYGGVMCDYLEAVKRSTDFGKWFYGHHHFNMSTSDNVRCLYSDIRSIDDNISFTPDEDSVRTRRMRFTDEKLQTIINKSLKERADVLAGRSKLNS